MAADFFDTSVLVYIASGDAAKADKAEATLTNVARRKMGMSWPDTHAFLNGLRSVLTVHPLTLNVHETGLGLAERYGFSTYDAMVAAAALHAGSPTLWSEDMQHGMKLEEGLRILNPFRERGR